MVIHAIETDSINRVEDIVGRLIDLFNSDESREFLESKIQQARDGLMKLENAMKVSLYGGMQAMRQLVVDVRIHLWSSDAGISRFQLSGQSLHYLLTHASDVLDNDSLSNEEKVKEIWDGITQSLSQDEDSDGATRRLEEFLDGWRLSCTLEEPKKQRLENQIRMDFKRGLEQQQTDIEDLFNQLREYFKGLKSKLKETVEDVKSGEEKYKAFGRAAIVVRGGKRFLDRKDPSWYPCIENSLFDYIRGNMTDDDLKKLIKDEQLQEDLRHIREHQQRWILSCRDLLDKIKIPVLNKKAFILEARRTWAFAKALLLGESEYVEHHSELLSQLINVALSSGDDVAPFISVARLPDGNQTLKLKLVAMQNADMQAVYALVCDIAKLAGKNAQVGFSKGKGTCVYEIKFDDTDGVKRFIGVIAKQTGRLAEVHVRAALMGEYDVNVGCRLTNPAFNRIYGRGLSAPGFRPTVFTSLNYSGEYTTVLLAGDALAST